MANMNVQIDRIRIIIFIFSEWLNPKHELYSFFSRLSRFTIPSPSGAFSVVKLNASESRYLPNPNSSLKVHND